MVDIQKVFAADAMRRAKDKVERAGRKPGSRPKSAVLMAAVEKASIESDDTLRDIWANLIANEILDNEVHPEFPRTLERLGSKDALTLAKVAETDKDLAIEPADFSREHLESLQLLRQLSGQ